MNLTLVVLNHGKSEGRTIPISRTQFVIGRAPECHLRPSSPSISKRHCVLLVRGDKVFVRDFNSTNGTFLNGRQIQGEIELRPDDRLKLGPIEFAVHWETAAPVAESKPQAAAQVSAPGGDDENAAEMLLSLEEADSTASENPEQAGGNISGGDTALDVLPPLSVSAKTDKVRVEEPPRSASATAGPERTYPHLKSRVEEKVLILTLTDGDVRTDKDADILRHEMLEAVTDAGIHRVIIDMSNVDMLVSTGLRPLIGVLRYLKPKNGQLVLCGMNREVEHVLSTTRVVGMSRSPFDAAADVPSALTLLRNTRR